MRTHEHRTSNADILDSMPKHQSAFTNIYIHYTDKMNYVMMVIIVSFSMFSQSVRASEKKEICHTSELSIRSRIVDRQFSRHKMCSSVNASTPSNIIRPIIDTMKKKNESCTHERNTPNRKLNAQLISDKWLLNTINALNMPSALLLLLLLHLLSTLCPPDQADATYHRNVPITCVCVLYAFTSFHLISSHLIAPHLVQQQQQHHQSERGKNFATMLRASYPRIYL